MQQEKEKKNKIARWSFEEFSYCSITLIMIEPQF